MHICQDRGDLPSLDVLNTEAHELVERIAQNVQTVLEGAF